MKIVHNVEYSQGSHSFLEGTGTLKGKLFGVQRFWKLHGTMKFWQPHILKAQSTPRFPIDSLKNDYANPHLTNFCKAPPQQNLLENDCTEFA